MFEILKILNDKLEFITKYDKFQGENIEDIIPLENFGFFRLFYKKIYWIRSIDSPIKIAYWILTGSYFIDYIIKTLYVETDKIVILGFIFLFFSYFILNSLLAFNLYFFEIKDKNYKKKLIKPFIYTVMGLIIILHLPFFINLFTTAIGTIFNLFITLIKYLLMGIIIFFFLKHVFFGDDDIKISRGRKSSKKENSKPKLSRAEKARLSAYKSVAKAGVKGSKPFYKRKGLLVCYNCGGVGKVTCDNCGYESGKRKQKGRCPNCGHFINKIVCKNCGLTQYLK